MMITVKDSYTKRLWVNALIFVFIACWSALLSAADEYTKGPGALQIFDGEGMAQTPLWVRIWLALLILNFALGLAFVRRNVIARWAVGGFAASFF